MSNEGVASINDEPTTSATSGAEHNLNSTATTTKKNDNTANTSSAFEQNFAKQRSLVLTECGFKVTTTENYLKRLQTLRKELNYISETDWMYEPVDKKPPQ